MRFAALVLVAMSTTAVASDRSAFERGFDIAREPASLHFVARYRAQGVEHRLEVWRDGQHRLRRRTDDAIDTIVTRSADGADFRMIVLDLQRHISTQVDRANLYRIGSFTDWFDLAHGLRHPAGDYDVVPSAVRFDAIRPLASCRWLDLVQGSSITHVCWSRSLGLPLAMVDGAGQSVWQVALVDAAPIPATVFMPRDEGFIHHDANAELDRD